MTLRTAPNPNRPAPARVRPGPMPPWGWLEWFIVIQSFIPIVLFIPGASPLRVLTRIAAFALALVAWLAIWRSGRLRRTGFLPASLLTICTVWLLLSIFNPGTNSLMSGAAQAAMYITVLSPVYWAPGALASSRQVTRILVVIFACNALSATLGIAQVYYPTVFNPQVIPALEDQSDRAEFSRGSLTYQTADGRTIIRPCGLSDNPGAASGAGVVTCLIGLCLVLRPAGILSRLTALALAVVGMAAVYYCQVRTAMVMIVFCNIGLITLFCARRDYRRAALLVAGTAALLVLAAVWVVAHIGDVGIKRFGTLLEERPDKLYVDSRGYYVQQAFETLIWDYPLGGGLGRYGQAFSYFGDLSVPYNAPNGPIWVEVQWPGWVVDGGLPLMVFYVAAIALALYDSARIALTSRDRELAYWASLICALNVSIASQCFSACPFIAQAGMNFWLLTAVLHEADRQVRARQPGVGPRPPARRAVAGR